MRLAAANIGYGLWCERCAGGSAVRVDVGVRGIIAGGYVCIRVIRDIAGARDVIVRRHLGRYNSMKLFPAFLSQNESATYISRYPAAEVGQPKGNAPVAAERSAED